MGEGVTFDNNVVQFSEDIKIGDKKDDIFIKSNVYLKYYGGVVSDIFNVGNSTITISNSSEINLNTVVESYNYIKEQINSVLLGFIGEQLTEEKLTDIKEQLNNKFSIISDESNSNVVFYDETKEMINIFGEPEVKSCELKTELKSEVKDYVPHEEQVKQMYGMTDKEMLASMKVKIEGLKEKYFNILCRRPVENILPLIDIDDLMIDAREEYEKLFTKKG